MRLNTLIGYIGKEEFINFVHNRCFINREKLENKSRKEILDVVSEHGNDELITNDFKKLRKENIKLLEKIITNNFE